MKFQKISIILSIIIFLFSKTITYNFSSTIYLQGDDIVEACSIDNSYNCTLTQKQVQNLTKNKHIRNQYTSPIKYNSGSYIKVIVYNSANMTAIGLGGFITINSKYIDLSFRIVSHKSHTYTWPEYPMKGTSHYFKYFASNEQLVLGNFTFYSYAPYKCISNYTTTMNINKSFTRDIYSSFGTSQTLTYFKFSNLPSIGTIKFNNKSLSKNTWTATYVNNKTIKTFTFTANNTGYFSLPYYARVFPTDSLFAYSSYDACYINVKVCYTGCSNCNKTTGGTLSKQYCTSCQSGYAMQYSYSGSSQGNCRLTNITISNYKYINSKWIQCYTGCNTCQGKTGVTISNQYCYTCLSGYAMQYYLNGTSMGNCRSTSSNISGYGLNSNNQWVKCYTGCSSCEGKINATANNQKCTACSSGYAMQYYLNGTSMGNCKSKSSSLTGYGLNKNNQWVKCYTGCSSCEGVINATIDNQYCTACSSGYGMLYDINNKSEGNCRSLSEEVDGYYKNNTKWLTCWRATELIKNINTSSLFTYTYNYRKQDTDFNFYINFTITISHLYTIYRKDENDNYIEITGCSYSKNILTCPVNENNFPINEIDESYEMKYDIYFLNNCTNEIEFSYYQIIVYKSLINYITFKQIEYTEGCSAYENGTKIYIYGNSTNINVFENFDFDNYLYLEGSNLLEEEEKIPLSCYSQKNTNYTINYQIIMICTITKTISNIPAPLKLSKINKTISLLNNDNITVNFINPINIKTKTKTYSPYYISPDISKKEYKLNCTSDDIYEEFEINFNDNIYYVPKVYIYSYYSDSNITLDCERSSSKSIKCTIDKIELKFTGNILVNENYKVYIINACGLTENINGEIKNCNEGKNLQIRLLALFALLLILF